MSESPIVTWWHINPVVLACLLFLAGAPVQSHKVGIEYRLLGFEF